MLINMTRRRLVLLTLVTLAGIGLGLWGPWLRPPDAREVRWPVTSPADRAQAYLRDRVLREADNVPLPPTDVADGVRVRSGEAFGLTYFEVILGDADFDDALPLVVLLHGRGDRPRIPGGPFTGATTPMRLVIPRGPLRLGAGYAWVAGSITQGTPGALAASLLARTHHLAALIATLAATLPTRGRPIVAGFSQGAMLSFSLALHRPDVVGRAFPLAGWVPPDLMPTAPIDPELRVPIRSVHGTQDQIVPIAPTREVVELLRQMEWEVELLEFEGVGHIVSPEMNARFEAWLEEALLEQAPDLAGRGLGAEGPESEGYEPWEPLEQETLDAIQQEEEGILTPEPEGGEDISPDDPGNPEDSDGGDATPEGDAPTP